MKLYRGAILIFFLCLCIINISACTSGENEQLLAGGESGLPPSETIEKLPEETKIEREYNIEDFMGREELPENIVWLEGEVPFGDISLGLKPVIGDALKKLIEGSEEDDYIGVFVGNTSTCGLVPKIRLNIDIFPDEMNSDGKLVILYDSANNSYEEYSKVAGKLLSAGKKVYELHGDYEFIVARNKAQNAYDEYYDYVKRETKALASKTDDSVNNYTELYYTVVMNHHFSVVEVRNLYFSSFGFIPYYSIEYLEKKYNAYYGEGYEYDPGYIYVAKVKDILSLDAFLNGQSRITRLYPLSKEYLNQISFLLGESLQK